ncbi:MAG: methyltransferase domain-containing protein [Methylophaga sp.]|nr:methyltransferase domain-containing protein [Methylophaga sp.]
MEDRNFDDLADRFSERIYNTEKGRLRLEILQEDLAELAAGQALNIWDAGCGLGQISLWLAQQGHKLTLCDISEKLLNKARSNFAAAGVPADLYHQSAQSLATVLPKFDLVINHAVLEWLAEPMAGLQVIAGKVKAGGYLSLMFYNRNAMVYQNVLRGGWRLPAIIDDRYIGAGNRLSPPQPLFPHLVSEWLSDNGFQIISHSGIRVFSDYLPASARAETDAGDLYQLEKQYCRLPAYRDLGRYVHLLTKKSASN